jgi:hypothetical protein
VSLDAIKFYLGRDDISPRIVLLVTMDESPFKGGTELHQGLVNGRVETFIVVA